MGNDRDLDDRPLSLEQLVQNINNIAQAINRLVVDVENGTGLLWQPLNSLLTSIAALSGVVANGNLIMGTGATSVALKTLSEVITASSIGNGTSGQFLKTNGAGVFSWGDAFVKVALQVFTGNTTYTPTTGTMFSLLGAVGGGAGGGGCANSTAGNQGQAGGGGGGSTSLAVKTAAQIGVSLSVTVGASANGGTAGNNNGTAGNDSSIGTLCVGKGGSGGSGAAANSASGGGAGGVAGTGDITIIGQTGYRGLQGSITTYLSPAGGGGASGMGFGYGAPAIIVGNAATNGSNYGGGGGGGGSAGGGGAAAGGNGAQGLCFALDFCKV